MTVVQLLNTQSPILWGPGCVHSLVLRAGYQTKPFVHKIRSCQEGFETRVGVATSLAILPGPRGTYPYEKTVA